MRTTRARFLRTLNSLSAGVDRLAEKLWIDGVGRRSRRATEGEFERAARSVGPPGEGVRQIQEAAAFAIDEEWLSELGRCAEVVLKRGAISYEHGRLLYTWLRQYIFERGYRWLNIVETGTARGFSALCLARALADEEVDGKILTLDVLPHDVPMLWNCAGDLRGPRTRAELLKKYQDLMERYLVFLQGDSLRSLRRLGLSRVHFAFLDGMHSEAYVSQEFRWLAARQSSGDVIVFDDYNRREFAGLVKAVDEGLDRYGYEATVVESDTDRKYLHAVCR